jgi:DNA ligase (NAD+)
MDALKAADRESLEQVDEIGERIASSLISYFSKEEHLQIIEQLRSAGLQMSMEALPDKNTGKLAGLSIVISGVFEKYSRDELKSMIEQHGGKNSSSISARTDYILAGENMGPSKYEKAQKLGVPIIDEAQFLDMLGK